jgi:hypothetical protein
MQKVALVGVLIVLSFFINLLYYVSWMLMDHWLEAPAEDTGVSVSSASTASV